MRTGGNCWRATSDVAESDTSSHDRRRSALCPAGRTLPKSLRAVPDIDIDLRLAPADQPGTSRRPDLVVVSQAEFDRVNADGGLLRATEAVLVVEIHFPRFTPHRLDNRRGNADAGVPHYWILDLDTRVSLIASVALAGQFGYQDVGRSPASSRQPSHSQCGSIWTIFPNCCLEVISRADDGDRDEQRTETFAPVNPSERQLRSSATVKKSARYRFSLYPDRFADIDPVLPNYRLPRPEIMQRVLRRKKVGMHEVRR